MRIVLVHPAGSNWIPGRRDVTATANRMAPLGILSIAAYLERKGTRCLFTTAWDRAPSPDGGKRGSHSGARPDLVGFSATTSVFPTRRRRPA